MLNRHLLICCLVSLLIPFAVLADSLTVAGQAQELRGPLITEGDEVLAPLTSSLRFLGAQATVRDDAVAITAADGRQFALQTGSRTAQADGRAITLAAAPRDVNGDLYLPARTVAGWLAADARFDPAAGALAVTPRVNISYEDRPEGVAVLVRGAGALQYTSGRLANPPRAFFDVKYASLGVADQQIAVNKGLVQRVRAAQYSSDPAVVRVVIDMSDTAALKTTVSEQGHLITILVGDKIDLPAPAPAPAPDPVVTAPKVAAPVRLLSASLSPQGTAQTALSLQADGALDATADYDAGSRTLTVSLPNALNTLGADDLRVGRDALVAGMTATGAATRPGTTLAIRLKQDAGYLLQRGPKSLKVLMGTFGVEDMTIVLDPGHGGNHSGAVGPSGLMEKNVTLDIMQRAAKLLRAAGAKVVMTRNDDSNPDLEARPALATKIGADLFISVHCNSTDRLNSGNGTQTYYYMPQSAVLAKSMQAELVDGLKLRNAGVFNNQRFVVISRAAMPSVLCEIAYINNTQEEALLADPDFRQKTAEALVAGVRRYASTAEWQQRTVRNAVD